MKMESQFENYGGEGSLFDSLLLSLINCFRGVSLFTDSNSMVG